MRSTQYLDFIYPAGKIFLQSWVFFLTGLLVTMPILTVDIGGRLTSLFTIVFAFFCVLTAALAIENKKRAAISVEFCAFSLWMTVSLVASVFGLLYFYHDPEWQSQIISYIPKIALYLILIYMLIKIKHKQYLALTFMRGFICGSVTNLIWATIEGVSYYYFETPLNDFLFVDYVKTLPEDRQYMTIIRDGIIRASGFNTDPAHLGGLIPIILVYGIHKRNIYLLSLSLIALIFSGSTTALVTSILSLCIYPWKLKLSRLDFKRFIFSIIAAAIVVIGVSVNEQIRDGISNNIHGFYERSTENYVENQNSGNRYVYHAFLMDAIQYSGLKTLIGTGYGTASYPYVNNREIASLLLEENRPYDPESTYISYLFDVGIIGLMLYLFVLVRLAIHYRCNLESSNESSIVLFSSLSSILFAGFFYHYTLTAYQVLILIFAICIASWNASSGQQSVSKAVA